LLRDCARDYRADRTHTGERIERRAGSLLRHEAEPTREERAERLTRRPMAIDPLGRWLERRQRFGVRPRLASTATLTTSCSATGDCQVIAGR
jgi:hypothetical protein